MTLQQLQYIVSVDNYRHFVKAAEACGVTQSTLSIMIRNLETELDTVIFDRTAHPVVPTAVGKKIIDQARVVLFNADQLSEITADEKSASTGTVSLGIIPTVAPYVLPDMFRLMKSRSGVALRVVEARTHNLLERLHRAELDMALLSTPLDDPSLLEIPVYYEKFYAYVSKGNHLWDTEEIQPSQLPGDDLWVLQEGHCFRNQLSNICSSNHTHSMVYESGSIDTLVKIVDQTGGYTVIPELHIEYLTPEQKKNVRRIVSPEPVREISLVVRNDYVKEGLLNVISDVIKQIIPDSMLDQRLKKFSIRI